MIGALLKHNVSGSPNERAVMQYLAFNLLEHNSETFFKNIQVLLPGHYIRLGLQDGKFELKRWYTPQRIENVDTGMIRDLFHESVRLRMLSDVPIGSCLSGGIDSTAIVSLLNKHCDGKTFKTFSFTAPGSSIDESKYMREAGKAFRAEQHFTTLSEDDFINSFEDFTGAVEEPVTGLSVYAQYTVMRLAKENGAKVLFDGQGSDEIFAGYIYYFSYLFYEMLTGGRLVGLARENIECVRNFKNLFPQALFVFMLLPARLKKFFFHATICDWVNFSLLQKETSGAMDPRWNKMTLQQILETTLFSTAIPHLLNWEDKNSMRWSVESRVPFLDHHLVEAAMSMPAGTKLKNGVTKAPFREAVSDLLPEMIRARKDKIGFAAPDDEFLRSPKVSAWAESVINSPSFKSRPYWDWAAVDKNHKKFLHCKNHNIGGAVFKWLSLEIWLRKFFG
jgi:asparagine synthase (glutamine-hydrolysing)